VHIPADILATGKVEVYTPGGGGIGILETVQSKLQDIIMEKKLQAANADSSLINFVKNGIDVSSVKVTEAGTEKTIRNFILYLVICLEFDLWINVCLWRDCDERGDSRESKPNSRNIKFLGTTYANYDG